MSRRHTVEMYFQEFYRQLAGHCPGSRGNQGKVRESEKGQKSQGTSGNLRGKKKKVREFN